MKTTYSRGVLLTVLLGIGIILLALDIFSIFTPQNQRQVINITDVGTGKVHQLVKITQCDVMVMLPQEPNKYFLLQGGVVCAIDGKRWQASVDVPPQWAGHAPVVVRNLTDAEWLAVFGKHLCTQNQTRYLKNNTTFVEECDWEDNVMPSGRGALGLVKRTWRINETGWASLHSGARPKDGVTEKRGSSVAGEGGKT